MVGAVDGERSKKTVFVTVGTTCFDSLVKAVDSLEVKEELLRKGYTDLLIQMGRGSYIPSKEELQEEIINAISSPIPQFTCVNAQHGQSVVRTGGALAQDFLNSIRGTLEDLGGVLNVLKGTPTHPPFTSYASHSCIYEDSSLHVPSVPPWIIIQCSGEDGSLAVNCFTFSPSIAEYLRDASLIISHAGSGSVFETLRLGKPLIVVVNEDLMDNHQSELAEELAERKHLFYARPRTLRQTIENMDSESLLPYHPGDAAPVAKLINRFLGFPAD